MNASCEVLDVFQVGNTVRTLGLFTNASDGSPLDPTEVFVTILDPLNVETTYKFGVDAIVQNGPGDYHFDFTVTTHGEYFIKWHSTGPLTATEVKIRAVSTVTT